MSIHFLTTKYYLKGRLLDLLESKLFKKPLEIEKNILSLRFKRIHWLRDQDDKNMSSIGYAFLRNGQKVFIKKVDYLLRNSFYEQLVNEYSLLSILGKFKNKQKGKYKIGVPAVYDFYEGRRSSFVVSEFLEGNSLLQIQNSSIKFILNDILKYFYQFTISLDRKIYNKLPKRTKVQTAISFLLYTFILLRKDKKNTTLYLKFAYYFYRYYLLSNVYTSPYIFAHRDLHPENIMVYKKSVKIFDPEISSLSEKHTDLAILLRLYVKFFKNEIFQLLDESLSSRNDRKRVAALSIFYSIQIMAIREADDPDYIEGFNYLNNYFSEVINFLIPQKSLVENIYSCGLKILSFFNYDKSSNPLILCYHLVDDNPWRFATNKMQFKNQLEYLRKERSIVSLSELIQNEKKNTVAITFDDGYKSLLYYAVPLLRKYKVPATFFVLGNPENANRDELKNTEKLFNLTDIKKLHSKFFTIGYHSGTHSDLRNRDINMLNEEIINSKKVLEKKLNFKLPFFAYPRGLYTKEVEAIIKKSDYSHAFTVDGGNFNHRNNKYLFSRTSVEGGIDIEQFIFLTTNLGMSYNYYFMKMLTIKERIQHDINTVLSPLLNVKNRNSKFYSTRIS